MEVDSLCPCFYWISHHHLCCLDNTKRRIYWRHHHGTVDWVVELVVREWIVGHHSELERSIPRDALA